MIDSHAHLGFSQFDSDRDVVIGRMQKAGVAGWIEIGTSVRDSQRALEVVGNYDMAWASVGVHPSDVGPLDDLRGASQDSVSLGRVGLSTDEWELTEKLLDHSKAVAVGEVGIDVYHSWPGFTEQQQLKVQTETLQRFVGLAIGRDVPVVFHVRSSQTTDAHNVLLAFLTALPAGRRPQGVVHTYSGTMSQAQRYLDFGLHLSFSGVVTFKSATEIAEVARTMPLDRMLIETDCPFLTPEPFRGRRNEPAYVSLVAQKIADLRVATVEEIDETTTRNTQALFRI